MATIKIHELIQTVAADIDESFYGIFDNGRDTYKVSLTDMMILFSSDKKLDALKKDIDNKILELQKKNDSINQSISSINSTQNKYASEIDILNKWKIKQTEEFSSLNKTVNEHSASIESFNKYANDNDKKYNELLLSVGNNADKISSINKQILQLISTLANVTEYLQNMQLNISKNAAATAKVNSELTNLINVKYNDILDIIDYYHHDSAYHPDDGEDTETETPELSTANYAYVDLGGFDIARIVDQDETTNDSETLSTVNYA